jgi:hypothetical protein
MGTVPSRLQHVRMNAAFPNMPTTSDMSREEITLRQENARLQQANLDLSELVRKLDALVAYGEQGDEPVAFTDENVSARGFPANALRHTAQRIGLFTPR